MKNNKLIVLLFLIFAFTLFSCETTKSNVRSDKVSNTEKKESGEGWVNAEGIGTINDNEIGKAKDDALNDAKRDAVKKVLGTMINSRTEIDSGVFQSSDITAKSEGLIETYKILESRAISKYEYQVTIRAKVSKAKLEEAIEDMISQQARPTMMVFVNENLLGKPNTDSQNIAGTAVESEFTKKGFPLVDRATFEKVRKAQGENIARALKGDNNAAKEIGSLGGAQIVLVGNSNITSAGAVAEGSKMISYQSDVSIRVIETTTGALIAVAQEHAAYPHINAQSGAVEATKKSVAKLSQKLIQEISKKWKTGKLTIIDVAIIGADYSQSKKIRSEFIEKVRGVKAVHRKESTGNITLLQIEFEGDSFAFTDRVIDANLTYPLTTGDVRRNYVEFKLK
ncbi:MAG: hypothetical protein OEV78_05155 [Spirochaetia bacterium]|nr:hypothetical protein [Spirochaetia bacterium]